MDIKISVGRLSFRYSSWHFPIFFLVVFLSGGFSTLHPNFLRLFHSFTLDPLNSAPFLESYHADSPLFFLIIHLVGIGSVQSFISFCVLLLLLTYVAFYLLARSYYSILNPSFLLLLLLAHPISHILLTWIGMIDVLSVLFASLLIFTRLKWPLVILLSFLYVLNHTSALFVVPVLLLLRYLAEDNVRLSAPLSGIIGVVLGKLCVDYWLLSKGIEHQSRLDLLLLQNADYWIRINFNHFPEILYSFQFLLWVPVVLMLAKYYGQNRLFYGVFAVSLFAFYGITFFTSDTTRVYALLSWAPTLYALMYTLRLDCDNHKNGSSSTFRQSLFASTLLSGLVPRFYVATGEVILPQTLLRLF